MRQRWFLFPALLAALVSGQAAADSVDLSLNDKALRAIYAFTPATKRGLEVDVGHYYTEHDITVTHAGLQVAGENWSKEGVFNIGLGGRLVYARADEWDESAVAFGGHIRFSPIQRLGIGGAVFYAPEVTTWGDGDNYLETEVKLDYQLLPQAYVYAGYRVIEVDYDDENDVKLDDRFHVGMKLLF